MTESQPTGETSPTRVAWVGDPGLAETVGTDRAVDPERVETPADLRSAAESAAACVVVGEPPAPLRSTLSSLPVPVVVCADVDPATVADVADDFIRPRAGGAGGRRDDGDGHRLAERLADRLAWQGVAGDASDGADAAATDRSKVEQLHDIATELATCREPAAVYDLVVDAAEQVLAFDTCAVDAVEDDSLVPRAVSDGVAEDGYDSAPVERGGLAGEAHLAGESSVVDDVRDLEAADPATADYRSVLTVPIGEAAVLQAASTDVGAFDASDCELAELLAAHAEGTLHRIRSEAADRRRRETIERLHDIVARMVACERESDLFDLLVTAAEGVLDFSVCVVLATDPDEDVLRVQAASNAALAPDVGVEAPVDRGLYGRTYREGTGFVVDDVGARDDARPHDERYGSALSVPMGDVGVVQAISTEPGAFDEHDREMAELLASQAGVVLTRLRAEGRLRTERDRLRALFDHVPDPAVSFTLEDGSPRVRDVNPAFEATFGADREAVVGSALDDFVVPAGEREAAALTDRLRAGESFHEEVRRVTADGEVRDFIGHAVPLERSTGNVAGYVIYTDITDRKRRERRLHSLNRTTRELLGATDADAVYEIAVQAFREILDLPATGVHCSSDGSLVLAAASATAWGLFDEPPPTYDPGDAVWRAYEAGRLHLIEDVDEDVLADDANVGTVMVVPLGEHGVVVSAGPGADTFDEGTRDLAGVLAANVEAALDRAERERRLRNRERELKRQNDRLDEFASVVSHDLRTPLSVARGHLDLARQDDDREALAKVADAHERMDALVDDLLALAREGRVVGDTEPVDVGAAVEAAWPAHEAGNATLTVADPGTVDADRERLEQLLENLLGNALEHGGDDVAVEVGSLAGEGHRDGFYVTDDGPGVPAADRDSVFERGFTTADDGIGFGLAIVREIATAHGWSVDLVESASGGARFEIRTR